MMKLALVTLSCSAIVLAGCHSPSSVQQPLPNLAKPTPIVISHRGYSGMYPEETQIAYEMAADAGGDYLETDMHLTKDCQIALRHNPWLSDNTNIAEVAKTHPEVASRKRTVAGVKVNVPNWKSPADGPAQYVTDLTDPNNPKSVLKSLVVDGEDHVNDWAVSDFTMNELRQWVKGTTYDNKAERPSNQNGKWAVLSLQDLINIAKAKGQQHHRIINIYPETKNPYWNNAQGRANGCPGTRPFEDAFIKVLKDNHLTSANSPIIVQSFDPDSLKYLRSKGINIKAVQLLDGVDIDYQTGKVVNNDNDVSTIIDGRPYSWTLRGDLRYFDSMTTPQGLAEIKTYADGIGPWKPYLASHTVTPWKTANADGTPFKARLADVNKITSTSLIKDAHQAGLFVHSFTFRNEKGRLAGVYNNDPMAEYDLYYQAGIDGVFTDFTPTALSALQHYLNDKN